LIVVLRLLEEDGVDRLPSGLAASASGVSPSTRDPRRVPPSVAPRLAASRPHIGAPDARRRELGITGAGRPRSTDG
jgi:hypothetical protein